MSFKVDRSLDAVDESDESYEKEVHTDRLCNTDRVEENSSKHDGEYLEHLVHKSFVCCENTSGHRIGIMKQAFKCTTHQDTHIS